MNTLRAVKRAGLTLLLLVLGLALVGGALTVLLPQSMVPETFRPLAHYVGTEGSVVGGAFGLGLIWSAWHPAGNRLWVHLAMLYSVLLLVREATIAVNGKSPSLAPIVFGLATLALLIALYPGWGRRAPEAAAAPPPEPQSEAPEPPPA